MFASFIINYNQDALIQLTVHILLLYGNVNLLYDIIMNSES